MRTLDLLDAKTIRAIVGTATRSKDERARGIFREAAQAVRSGRTFLTEYERSHGEFVQWECPWCDWVPEPHCAHDVSTVLRDHVLLCHPDQCDLLRKGLRKEATMAGRVEWLERYRRVSDITPLANCAHLSCDADEDET